MSRLPDAFRVTKVPLDETLRSIERLLQGHGVRGQRWTNESPIDDTRRGELGRGRLIYQFIYEGTPVTVEAGYHPKDEGTTAQIAARALLWLLQNRFDGIDWGVETFEQAFIAYTDGGSFGAPMQVGSFEPEPLQLAGPEDDDATDD